MVKGEYHDPKSNGAFRLRIRAAYLNEIIQAIGEEDILEEIGADKCKEHFDLKDNEE